VRTSSLVADRSRSFGCDEVHTGVAQTGVVVTIKGGDSQKAIGRRINMDGLEIMESNHFKHRSTDPGCLPACGHDGHTAITVVP